jgi:hypothetical protein
MPSTAKTTEIKVIDKKVTNEDIKIAKTKLRQLKNIHTTLQ